MSQYFFCVYSKVSKLVEDSEFNVTIPDVFPLLKPKGSNKTDVIVNVHTFLINWFTLYRLTLLTNYYYTYLGLIKLLSCNS